MLPREDEHAVDALRRPMLAPPEAVAAPRDRRVARGLTAALVYNVHNGQALNVFTCKEQQLNQRPPGHPTRMYVTPR